MPGNLLIMLTHNLITSYFDYSAYTKTKPFAEKKGYFRRVSSHFNLYLLKMK